eukprot:NODE_294_length_1699_cov_121.677481_g264_i0.p1 GENE.NODE_294_length_1699_cov_121.677481_g264_i0~~NODE_294_length_1699_cov_121.677481_g264_i0.p1  ORF type:complete len:521 (-),score=91.85 NODE_294_length_1699_cov_121.677481_g264_i0:32-1594(-)
MAEDCVLPIAGRPAGSRIHRIPKEFEDIQVAINVAKPGDCICIASGTYVLNEPLLLDKDLHLLGDDDGMATGVVLQMDRHAPSLLRANSHMITICAQSVRLTHFTFTHMDSSCDQPPVPDELVFCIYAKEGNVLLDDCSFHSTFASGLGVGTLCRPTITNCRFVAREYGIYCCRQTLLRCRQCAFTDCGTALFFDEDSTGCVEENSVTNCTIGIEATQGAYPAIKKHTVENCKDVGIFLSSASTCLDKAQVEGNQISQCGVGIRIEYSANPECSKNTISDCKTGVLVDHCGRGTVILNDISTCTLGIHMLVGSLAQITKNTIHHHSQTGVLVEAARCCPVIKDNEIYENAEYGVHVIHGASPAIVQNVINNNQGGGVYCDHSTATVVQENKVHDNGAHGLTFVGASPEVLSNQIVSNEGKGIVLTGNSGGEVACNEITGNQEAGLDVDGSTVEVPVIRENTVRHNIAEGILIHNNSRAVAFDNESHENKGENFYVALNSEVYKSETELEVAAAGGHIVQE